MKKFLLPLFIISFLLSGEALMAQTPQPVVQPAKAAQPKPKPQPKAKTVAKPKSKATAAAKKDTVKTPQIVDSIQSAALYLEVKEHNFGEVREGEVVNHQFVFWNIGTQDLLLTDVKASCGCTTPGYSKEPVKPGASGIINVQFDSKGRPGAISKTVTIRSNDPRHPGFQVLRISGNVVPPSAPAPASEPGQAH